jgi:hypothetical protein
MQVLAMMHGRVHPAWPHLHGGLHTKSNFLATLGRERHRPQGEPSSGNKTALDWLKN